MTTHVTKTWIQDGKLITEIFEEKEIYKREWVGLTDSDLGMYISKELAEYCNGSYADTGCAKDQLIYFARAIEAKLKEKNT